MQEVMRRYADTLRHKGYPPLQMRVGLNTGEVVVRSIRKDDLHTDYVPVGHSTNLAARMEQLANPGTIVVSAYTHRLTDGFFAFKDLGPTQIKGVEEPLHIYEVLGVGALRTRLQVAARRGLTRFVGRQSEMEQLQRALEHAKAGHGQIVGTMGEPGLGKSRLFYEFKLLSVGGCLVLEAYSVSHGKATAYLPVIELLKSYFDIQAQDDERKRREKVTGKVLSLDRSLEDTLPYLFALLGIPDLSASLQQMDAQIRRRRTFEALKKLFLRESLNQPLILIFEDLHWIDGETQGFLDVLSESVASAKLLLLTNYRPEYRHEWGQKTYYTQLRLAPLGREEAEELLTFLLGTDASLTPVKALILEKTQGTPFFMEEVVQTLAEEGALSGERGSYRLAQAPTTLQLPATVQAILAARIDRLAPDEKALLQQLSVIGREFPLGLIRQVITQPEADLYRLLASLQRKEFLYEQPAFPEVEYIFKHALTQEVAYGTVLQEQRKALHEQTARVIEVLYRTTADDHYSELAHHFSRSGNTPKAVEYLQLAGQQALQRSATAEAVTQLSAALALLRTLPDTLERSHHELTLQTLLGPALQAVKGWVAPEVEQLYTRSRELCRQLGESTQSAWVLLGLRAFYDQRAEYQKSRDITEEILSLAQRVHDPAVQVVAHYVQAWDCFFFGEIVAARERFEQLITLYDPQQHRSSARYGVDVGVLSRGGASLALWLLGYPAQALQRMDDARALAQQLSHLPSVTVALIFTAILHSHRREGYAAQERARALIALAQEHGFPLDLAWGTILYGWALAEQGQEEEGIAQLQQGLAAWRAIFRPYFLTLLAEAYGQSGQIDNGLATVAEALDIVNNTGERFYEAELYRIKGQLVLESSVQSPESSVPNTQHLTPSTQAEAEECFLKAIEIAQKQQAKSLELRATMSLARLWQSRGKRAEAHQMLSAIYNWFTEGFDTKDLQEAKALLQA
jgi:predicted ATPase